MAWNPQDYHFEPYELQAQRLPPSVGLGTSDNVRKKGGRQRRSSILCQVSRCMLKLNLAGPFGPSLQYGCTCCFNPLRPRNGITYVLIFHIPSAAGRRMWR